LRETCFLDRIMDFNKDDIPQHVIDRLEPYVENPEFVPFTVRRVSRCMSALCTWVKGMYIYNQIAKTVLPKKQAFLSSKENYEHCAALMKITQVQFQSVQGELLEAQMKAAEANTMSDVA